MTFQSLKSIIIVVIIEFVSKSIDWLLFQKLTKSNKIDKRSNLVLYQHWFYVYTCQV